METNREYLQAMITALVDAVVMNAEQNPRRTELERKLLEAQQENARLSEENQKLHGILLEFEELLGGCTTVREACADAMALRETAGYTEHFDSAEEAIKFAVQSKTELEEGDWDDIPTLIEAYYEMKKAISDVSDAIADVDC